MWCLRECFFLLNNEFTAEEVKLRAVTKRQWFSTSWMQCPASVKQYLIKKWSYGCCGRVSWLLVHGQQLPWLLWPERLRVIAQAMFSHDPPVWCMHLALWRLICKSCFIEHLFSQKLGILHTSGFYVPFQVLFLSYDPG
jgi:hypothetical protein